MKLFLGPSQPRQSDLWLQCEAVERLYASFVVPEHKKRKEVPIWIANTSKGPLKKQKAPIKDTAGKVTGDKKLESGGKLDKAKGSAHNVAGDVKDAVKESNK